MVGQRSCLDRVLGRACRSALEGRDHRDTWQDCMRSSHPYPSWDMETCLVVEGVFEAVRLSLMAIVRTRPLDRVSLQWVSFVVFLLFLL